MKNETSFLIKFFILFLVVPAIVGGLSAMAICEHYKDEQNTISPIHCEDSAMQIDEWNLFVDAIVQTESEGKHNAKGSKSDFGVLQITPIYVAEVNRILGEDKYSHTDALDSLKSIEMFEVVQSCRNPKRSFKRALALHNPRAVNPNYMTSYETEVMYHYYKSLYEIYKQN